MSNHHDREVVGMLKRVSLRYLDDFLHYSDCPAVTAIII